MNIHVEEPQTSAHVDVERKTRRRKSLFGTIVALLVLAAIGWLAWHLTHSDKSGGPRRPGGGTPPTTVGVATAERMDIPVVLEALGTVTAPVTATVRAQVSGVLQKVLFNEGQMVEAGQVLAQIDPRQFEMALMQATGQRQRDEAQLQNAKLMLERFRTLLSQDSIAKQDVDTQAALVKQLEGTVVADRANEGTARLNLGYTRIVAPVAGRVGLRAVDVGNVVSPGDANGIAVITQVSPIDVSFAIPQDRVPELRESINAGGAPPVVALDRSRATVLDTGSFLALDNQVDTQTGTMRAKARFTNAKQALFPNQFVNIRLQMRNIEGAVVVPVTALRHGSNGDFVYVLNAPERTVALRPVKSGQATVDKVQIVSGLAVGEQVITEGADRLKDGAKVLLPGDKPAAGGAGGRRQNGQASGQPSGQPSGQQGERGARQGADASPASGRQRRRSSEASTQ